MDRNLRIRMLLEAAERVTKPLRDITGGSTRAAQALKATRERLDELEKSQSRIASFRSLRQGLGETTVALKQARGRVAELAAAIAASDNPTKKMRTELERAETTVSKLSARQREQAASLRTVRGEFAQSGTEVRRLASVEQQLSQDIAHANTELAEQQRRLQQASDRAKRFRDANRSAGKIQNAATGLAAGGFSAIQTGRAAATPLVGMAAKAIAFESRMADVRKVVDGLDDKRRFQAMSNDVLALSKRLPIAADGIAEIVAAGGQSGIAKNELLRFAEDAAKMGVAFDINADQAGQTMAQWRTAFGVGRDGVVKLADQINYLGNTGAASAPVIADIVTRIGPLGTVGGLASGQIAALGSTLAGMGIQSDVAATGIKNTMLALTKGGAATKAQSDAFRALGLDAVQVSQNMQKDAGGTILDVMGRIGKLSKEQQAGVLTKLFGSESVSAIAPLLTQLDVLKGNFDKVADAGRTAGSMEAEYQSRSQTTANKLQLAQNQYDALQITIGTKFLPVINDMAEKFGKVADKVSEWTNRHPGLTKALAYTAGALAGLFFVIGGGAIAIAGLLTPFAALKWASKMLDVKLLPSLARLGAGLIKPLRYLPALGRGILGMAGMVGRAGLMLLTNPVFLAIAAAVAVLAVGAYLIYRNWGPITEFFSGIWKMIVDGFNAGIGGITALLVDFSPMGLLYAGIAALVNWLGGSLPTRLSEAGYNMIAGLVKGMLGALGWVKNTVTGIGTRAVDWFKQTLGIHSPSRVFMGLGGYMMQGLTNGIAAGENGPLDRLTSLSKQMRTAIALGTAAPAIAAPGLPPGGGAAAASASGAAAAPTTGPITIQIFAAPNHSEQQIAAMVARAMQNPQPGMKIGSGSSYHDAPDLGDMA